jgi:hypothetical protein
MAQDTVCRNGYSGYKISAGDTIDRVDPNIDPKSFYELYVATRKPCIIVGALGDKDWKAGDRWVNVEYLKENAGHVELDVERRESASDKYGQNKKVWLRPSWFLMLVLRSFAFAIRLLCDRAGADVV